MPPPPEFLDGLGKIGGIEVLRQMNAQHFRPADGHIGVSRKVAIDLQGIHRRGKHQEDTGIALVIFIDRIDQHRRPICNAELQEEAPGHGEKAPAQSVKIRLLGLFILRQQLVPPADGSGKELGKEGDKQGKPQEALLWPVLSFVDIDQVSRRLEGEEGDARRLQQAHPGHGLPQPQSSGQGVDAVKAEVQVFVHQQSTQGSPQAQPKQPPPLFLPQQQPGRIHQHRQPQQQHAEALTPAGIEHIACHQQKPIAPLCRCKLRQHQHNGEKQQKAVGIEDHSPSCGEISPFSSSISQNESQSKQLLVFDKTITTVSGRLPLGRFMLAQEHGVLSELNLPLSKFDP